MRDAKRGARAPAILVAVFLVGAAVTSARANPPEAPPPGFAWKGGAQVYENVCAYCHRTGVAPVLAGRGLPPPYILFVVRHGGRAMPAFRAAEIDDATLAKLAEYVSKLPSNP